MTQTRKPKPFANNHNAVASSRSGGRGPIAGSRETKIWSVSCSRPECGFKVSHAGTKRDAERTAEDHNRYAEALPPVETGFKVGDLVIIHISWADHTTYGIVYRTFGWSTSLDVAFYDYEGAHVVKTCYATDIHLATVEA